MKKKLVLAFIALDLVVLGAWLYGRAHPAIGGTLEIHLAKTSTTFHPTQCKNGSAWGFHGVALRGADARPTVRIVRAAGGNEVRIETDSGEVTLNRDNCPTFEVAFRGQRQNKGTLSLSCQVPGKGTVKGSLRFSHCWK